jgi:hypothetical protein
MGPQRAGDLPRGPGPAAFRRPHSWHCSPRLEPLTGTTVGASIVEVRLSAGNDDTRADPGQRRGRVGPLLAVGAVTAALLSTGIPSAQAHKHPTPIERAAPGVVYVQAAPRVDVAIIEHRPKADPSGVHIGITQSTWNPVVATASGFVVDPSGATVTTGAVTTADLSRARVYAVNQAFHQKYGAQAPLPADPFTTHRIAGDNDNLQQRLRACYPPNRTNDSGGCVIKVTKDYVVYPYVTSQARYGTLQATVLQGSNPNVAVLKVGGASSMPTVALGQSAAGAKALGALGFTDVPGAAGPHRLKQVPTHLAEVGGNTLKTKDLPPAEVADAARLVQGLQHGMAGGPLVAENGQVVGFLAPLPATFTNRTGVAPPLVGIATVLAALDKAHVAPHGGPVDRDFELAMHPFKNGGFASSVPLFTKTLDNFPGHLLASENLSVAKRKAAAMTASTMAPSGVHPGGSPQQGAGGGGGLAATLWIAAALLLLLLAAAAAWLLLRRRQGAGGGESGATNPGSAEPTRSRASSSGKAGSVTHPPVATSASAGRLRVKESNPSGSAGAVDPARGPGEPPAARRADGPAPAADRGPGAAAVQTPAAAADRGHGPRAPDARGQDNRSAASAVRSPGRGVPDAAPASRPVAGRADPSDKPSAVGGRNGAASPGSTSRRTEFCTWCGARVGQRYRHCGACGQAVGALD